MISNHIPIKDTQAFSRAVEKLRSFFQKRGFLEVHTQDRLSILAACEDPTTVATYEYAGEVWPLPQTGQMWLEYELLTRPQIPGVFTVSTSYRNEKDPVPGRHESIFPMFEFEAPGTLADLRQMEIDLLNHLGFGSEEDFKFLTYEDAVSKYGQDDISSDVEMKMHKEFGPVVFLENFPEYTSPFWNMSRSNGMANKIDVILHGMETIGSAERSCDSNEMRKRFETISDGEYADLLFRTFGKERVEKELSEFLSLEFFPRFGGGIGMTRMVRALSESNLLN